jgi:hypothetical protein
MRHHRNRLAAAAFTDDGHRLAFTNVKGDAIDGKNGPFRRMKADAQILHIQKGGLGGYCISFT